jgi:hypothetical protein
VLLCTGRQSVFIINGCVPCVRSDLSFMQTGLFLTAEEMGAVGTVVVCSEVTGVADGAHACALLFVDVQAMLCWRGVQENEERARWYVSVRRYKTETGSFQSPNLIEVCQLVFAPALLVCFLLTEGRFEERGIRVSSTSRGQQNQSKGSQSAGNQRKRRPRAKRRPSF